MLTRVVKRARVALGAAAIAGALSVSPLLAQGIEAPSGPGQAVAQPPAQCPDTISCTYSERNFPPDGYRLQRLDVCGANCTSQYWVSTIPDGAQVLEIDPVRGGGVIAVAQSTGQDPHPAVRTVMPDPQSGDPACCPSQYADTTYTWDDGSASLVPGTPAVIPAADFGGWDDVRAALQSDKYVVVFP
jgi:hypothetical protein